MNKGFIVNEQGNRLEKDNVSVNLGEEEVVDAAQTKGGCDER